jgi:hypothetical protein
MASPPFLLSQREEAALHTFSHLFTFHIFICSLIDNHTTTPTFKQVLLKLKLLT